MTTVTDHSGPRVAERVPCPYCATPSGVAFLAHDENRRLSSVRFPYHRCPGCSLLFLAEIPSDLGRYYPEEYYAVPESRARLAEQAEAERWKLEMVQRYATGGRLLEVGPAYGLFAYLARQAGFDVDTIEMDERCRHFLRDVAGVRARANTDLASDVRALGTFDVIVLWQVIEHLERPWEALEALAAGLEPGGVLVIATPNPEALQARVLGRHWAHVDAPRHLALMGPTWLAARAAELGLRIEHQTTSDAGSVGWNSFGWAMSLRNRWTAPLARRAAFLGGRVIARTLAPVERSGGRGSSYTAIFRKPGDA
jgi:SAM-dependent methyltransferase